MLKRLVVEGYINLSRYARSMHREIKISYLLSDVSGRQINEFLLLLGTISNVTLIETRCGTASEQTS